VTGTVPSSLAKNETTQRRLLIVASGSITTVSLPGYLTAFRFVLPAEVRVILTRSGAKMLAQPVMSYFCDAAYDDENPGPGHVELARWPEAILVLPATANTIANIASGFAGDLATTVLLASMCPVIVFPVMNRQMWEKPSVQRNLKTVEADGVRVVRPDIRMGYEIASKSMQENPMLPNAEDCMNVIRESLSARGESA